MSLLPRRLLLRLTMASILSIALAMTGFTIYVLTRDEEQRFTETTVRAQSLVEGMAAAISAHALIHDYETIQNQLAKLALSPDVFLMALTDSQGRPHAGIQRLLVGGNTTVINTEQLVHGEIRAGSARLDDRVVIWKPLNIGLYPMWLSLQLAIPDGSARRAALLQDTLLAALLAAALGTLTMLVLLRRPVGAMEAATRFSVQLPHGTGQTLRLDAGVTEVDELVSALNSASQTLARQQEALEQGRKRSLLRTRVLEMLAGDAELNQILDHLRFYLQSECPGIARSILLTTGAEAPHVSGNDCVETIRDNKGNTVGHLAYRRADQVDRLSAYEDAVLGDAIELASMAIEQKRIGSELQIAASVYRGSSEAMFVTDERNLIVAVNAAFTRYTGYESHEVIGKDPGILGSGRTEQSVYLAMWRSLETTGQWQGEIWNRRKSGEEFAEWLSINTIHNSDGSGFRRIALFSDITEKKRNEELIWHQANYDPLTLLPNRRLFLDRAVHELRRAQGRNIPIIMMYIDLDRFKEVNDAHGHAGGDMLLQEAACRLSACIRDGDTLARLGGDEFAVLLPSVPDPIVAERIASNMLGTLSRQFEISGEQIFISGSIGVTRFPDDAEDAETLLANAERAMYLAKNAGRQSFAWFTQELQEGARARHHLMKDLRRAVGTGEFEIYYQPIVSSASGRIVKAEALLRWNHPRAGQVSPTAFIPLAEETGMIGEIGDWVFRQVVAHLKLWNFGDQLQVSLNLSPRQFANPRISHEWVEYLAQVGVPARPIVIELTEGSLLDGSQEIADHLARFRSAGLQIAIDDFGTGYSALSYLQRFAVDYLKIDRSFIRDLAADNQDRALADAIIVMAHKLGLQVVAEGVETQVQQDYLLSVGCDYLQGYLFGRPMPVKDFAALLDAQDEPDREQALFDRLLMITPQPLH